MTRSTAAESKIDIITAKASPTAEASRHCDLRSSVVGSIASLQLSKAL
jgi:hypothetical protein